MLCRWTSQQNQRSPSARSGGCFRRSTSCGSWPSTNVAIGDGEARCLRREGLYTSSISEWRRQRDEGALQALGGDARSTAGDPRERELAQLRQENAALAGGSGQSPAGDRRPAKTLSAAGAARHGQRGADWRRAEVMVDQTIAELAPILGKRAACAALGRSRATYYRHHRQSPPPAATTSSTEAATAGTQPGRTGRGAGHPA